jgi:hypothetical protein
MKSQPLLLPSTRRDWRATTVHHKKVVLCSYLGPKCGYTDRPCSWFSLAHSRKFKENGSDLDPTTSLHITSFYANDPTTWQCTGWITELTNSMQQVLPEKLTGPQLVKKFPALYETRRFITAITTARHLSLSWAKPIQSTPLIPFLENTF